MKKIVTAVGGTTAGLVLLLSSKAGHTAALPLAQGAGTSTGSTGTSTGSGTGSSASGTASTGASSAGSSTTSTTKTVTGTAEDTRYGPVQVRITVAGKKITAVTAVQLPQDDGRSIQISQVAGPELASEAMTTQSAKIDTISGATYTSEGYAASLQSAIDAAGL